MTRLPTRVVLGLLVVCVGILQGCSLGESTSTYGAIYARKGVKSSPSLSQEQIRLRGLSPAKLRAEITELDAEIASLEGRTNDRPYALSHASSDTGRVAYHQMGPPGTSTYVTGSGSSGYATGSGSGWSGGSLFSGPGVAENGSYYGQISNATGRPKTVSVRGYTRTDGTYVRGHYRSSPRR